MNILTLFSSVSKDKIKSEIDELESERNGLRNRIKEEISSYIKTKFEGENEEKVYSDYSKEIEQLKNELFEEYNGQIDKRIKQLRDLEKDTAD